MWMKLKDWHNIPSGISKHCGHQFIIHINVFFFAKKLIYSINANWAETLPIGQNPSISLNLKNYNTTLWMYPNWGLLDYWSTVNNLVSTAQTLQFHMSRGRKNTCCIWPFNWERNICFGAPELAHTKLTSIFNPESKHIFHPEYRGVQQNFGIKHVLDSAWWPTREMTYWIQLYWKAGMATKLPGKLASCHTDYFCNGVQSLKVTSY